MMKLYVTGLLLLMGVMACTKSEEPPKKIGQELPYPNTVTKSLAQLLDSIPEASMYKTAFDRSTLQHYMDSLSGTTANAPFTLLVPTNKALQAAGYTTDNLNTAPAAALDTLVRYLALAGKIPVGAGDQFSETGMYPLMYPDKKITRTQVPSPFSQYSTAAYFYKLTVGFNGKALLLNGKQVSAQATPIAATNGMIVLIDSLVTKPFYESYQVLNMDTSFSFYMAALKKNNALYKQKGMLGSFSSNIKFNDTVPLVLVTTSAATIAGKDCSAIIFAPDNNAFRKAGLASVEDINNYIDRSALASMPNNTPMLTNMDSILVNHRLLLNVGGINVFRSYLYIADIVSNPYNGRMDNGVNMGAILLQNSNGQITLHRQDAPAGRGAVITGPSDITTLNGVIHRVNNLLLPTP